MTNDPKKIKELEIFVKRLIKKYEPLISNSVTDDDKIMEKFEDEVIKKAEELGIDIDSLPTPDNK